MRINCKPKLLLKEEAKGRFLKILSGVYWATSSTKLFGLLVGLHLLTTIVVKSSAQQTSGLAFCGHSSFEGETNEHFRPKRYVPLETASSRLLRAAQSRYNTENGNNNNNYETNQDKPVIDSNSNEDNSDDCSGDNRQQQRARRRSRRHRNGSSWPDECNGSTATSGKRPNTSSANSDSSTVASTTTTTDEPVKTIETAVFIDQALDNRFNGLSGGLVELNRLVLTIMNQVQHLFRYSSLHVPIKIKLILIEHLRDSERNGFGLPDSSNGDIDLYLSSFCNWQQSRLEKGGRKQAWDHAILLSGLDLYKATPKVNQSGVLGLAWVGGMCKGNYSCTVNEASNFESAFVIAHELGHSLGIMHDGQRNGCDPNGFIMSERTGAGKVNWSKCSNKYLSQSIGRKQLQCLDEESTESTDSMYELAKLRAPGQTYTINEQCKLAFGNNYTSFVTRQHPFNNVCRELWCVAGTWAKAAHPALEASVCADQERVCREGKCAQKPK